MENPSVTVEPTEKGVRVLLAGRVLTQSLHQIETALARISAEARQVQLDFSRVEALDTGGACLISRFQRQLEDRGVRVALEGLDDSRSAMLRLAAEHLPRAKEPEAPPRGALPALEKLGAGTVGAWQGWLQVMSFFGLTLHRVGRAVIMPWRLRPAALFTQMDDAGLKAIPIIALMGFLIGVVLAFQGSVQLRQFGAEIFVVDLIAISILRELGVLLTAIIVAGRSGSAYTAAIGSMKVREEIDAMRALGLDPVDVLVVPRTLALLVMLPILAMIANLAGLVGGALMSWIDLGVSPGLFFARLRENTDIWHLFVGLIKAPFFAYVISLISCYQAFQVRGSSQSLGAKTTSAVVQSIFAVILVDALFSVFFSEVGV